LDLRDNQLKALPSLMAFTALRYLEVSYNEVGPIVFQTGSCAQQLFAGKRAGARAAGG
jgi:hypothetical protein